MLLLPVFLIDKSIPSRLYKILNVAKYWNARTINSNYKLFS